jgi:hypothetical protein
MKKKILITYKEMSQYYRESFEYPSFKLFLNRNAADVITNKGNATFLLQQIISVPSDVIGYVSLSELTIPNTNYNVTSSNNTIVIVNNLIQTTITVPVGNYTVTSLLNELNTLMSVDGYTITYNDIQCTYTFVHDTHDFTFQSTSKMLSVLGFEENTSYSSTTQSLTSVKIVDLSGNNSFYVTTNLATNNYNFINSGNGRGSNVLAKIQLTTDGTGIEFYTNQQNFKCKFMDKRIPFIQIVLYDEDGHQWTPASDWSCVLDLIFYEKYNDANISKLTNKFEQMQRIS